jgi:hypothetical protein
VRLNRSVMAHFCLIERHCPNRIILAGNSLPISIDSSDRTPSLSTFSSLPVTIFKSPYLVPPSAAPTEILSSEQPGWSGSLREDQKYTARVKILDNIEVQLR